MTISMRGRWKTAIGYGALARRAARIATPMPTPASKIIPPKASRICANRLVRGRGRTRKGSSSSPHSVGPLTVGVDQSRKGPSRRRREWRLNRTSLQRRRSTALEVVYHVITSALSRTPSSQLPESVRNTRPRGRSLSAVQRGIDPARKTRPSARRIADGLGHRWCNVPTSIPYATQ
jgi:hypothetical protein